MEDTKYLLSFKGNKKDLHKQFKEWCLSEGESMNATILNLIKNHLKQNENNKLIKNGQNN